MKEITFKDRKSSHKLFIGNKWIEFKNGEAVVSDKDADAIKELGNSDYQIVKGEVTKEAEAKPKTPKPKPRTPKKK